MRGDPPADDHPGVGIDDEADVGHPGPSGHERQIGDPELVGRGRAEFALDQIGVPLGAEVGSGGLDPFAAPCTFDTGAAHQPGHLIPADVVAGPTRRLPQLADPIDAIVLLPQRHQCRTQDGITLGPL